MFLLSFWSLIDLILVILTIIHNIVLIILLLLDLSLDLGPLLLAQLIGPLELPAHVHIVDGLIAIRMGLGHLKGRHVQFQMTAFIVDKSVFRGAVRDAHVHTI